jgi:RNA polymerase sigma factor (sigma-70 family)
LSDEEIERGEHWLYEKGLDLYLPVLRTIYRAIEREVEAGLVELGELDAEELAFATYQRALAELRQLPQLPRDLFGWLRHLARNTVHRAALDRHSQRHRPAETSAPPEAHRPLTQPLFARLEAVFRDPDLPFPDDLLEDEAARRILDSLLARLPEQWREIYLLSALDRWSDEQIATVTGLLPDEVHTLVHATARFLHSWLHELASQRSTQEA